jgi:hypothetical protein
MADALDALDQISAHIAALADAVTSGRSKLIPISVVQPLARSIATVYFESVRTDLQRVQSRTGLVEEIDFVVQAILQLASTPSERQAFIDQIREVRPYILEVTIDLMKARGTPRLVLSQTERTILETLAAMLPSTAASYEQALRDFTHGVRVSWRGTATELREALREVIDYLAPDDKVTNAAGFQLEPKQTGPTQKQKVRFILRARRNSSAAVTVAEASSATVDEAVAILARSAYQRGSASTHSDTSAKEIKNLKRYVDALLAELLEIG